jgi:hypothetical protein
VVEKDEKDVRGIMEKLPNFSPHLITHPVALAALGVVAVIILAIVGASWYAYGLVVLILVAVFASLIKFPQLRMEGEHLYNYQIGDFDNFEAEATQSGPREDSTQQDVDEDIDALRVQEYKQNRGLFLVHAWKPSEKQGQVADIIIRLEEHRDTSTRPSLLREGIVESVRYELGRRFFKEPPIKRNPDNGFALEVSAYRPMLCLAEVRFNDDNPPVHLSRYIDFPTDSPQG